MNPMTAEIKPNLNMDKFADNEDVLSPLAAMQEISAKAITRIAEDLMLDPQLIADSKSGIEVVNFSPNQVKGSQLRSVRDNIRRRLTVRESGSPAIVTIREEFEVAAVQAYQKNSLQLFYLRSMALAFLNNHHIQIGKDAVAYELNQLEEETDGITSSANTKLRMAYHNAFSNVMRFHPLYVSYLYEMSGDNERAETLFNEVVEHYGWLVKKAYPAKFA